MRMIYMIIFTALLLNLSIGIVLNIFPDFFSDDVSYQYREDHARMLVGTELEGEIEAVGGVLEDPDSQTTNALDLLGLGVIEKWLRVLDSWMNAIGPFLAKTVGDFMSESTRNFWFGGPDGRGGVVSFIVYTLWIIGAIGLWTGKDLFRN